MTAGDMEEGAVSESIVDTVSGKVRGRVHDGVHVFRGIPYAAAPMGDRRFTAPQPPAPWPDVRDALHAGPVAPQPASPLVGCNRVPC